MSQYVKNVLVGLSRPSVQQTKTKQIKQVAATVVAAANNPHQAVESARQMILGCQESQLEPITMQDIGSVNPLEDLPYV